MKKRELVKGFLARKGILATFPRNLEISILLILFLVLPVGAGLEERIFLTYEIPTSTNTLAIQARITVLEEEVKKLKEIIKELEKNIFFNLPQGLDDGATHYRIEMGDGLKAKPIIVPIKRPILEKQHYDIK